MTGFEAVVLGIVQGATEFLPISSTAHLRIVPALAGWEDPGAAFTAVTQLGTMAAVVLFFRRDLQAISVAWLKSVRNRELRRSVEARMGWYIVLGTVPIGIAGLAFKDQVETGARDLYLIGSTLILLGLVLAAAERYGSRRRDLTDLGPRDGLGIGIAQALALVPGVSRSGATISAGLFLGLDRASAARYSFLLSIPAVVLSGLLEFVLLLTDQSAKDTPMIPLAVATTVSFAVGYASIAFLMRFLVSHSTAIFVGYRVLLGASVLALTATGAIA